MGLFITFEGVEGCGKSTQARALHARLKRNGESALLLHEPGGTPLGNRIGRLLKTLPDVSPLAELMLFTASRAQLVSTVIRPALARGQAVICDRFTDSTLAYQGYGRGLPMPVVQKASEMADGGLRPRLTVLLDVQPEEGLRRKGGPGDRFEREELTFHQRVRNGYLELAAREPGRWLVLDGSQPRKEIASIIWKRVAGLPRRSDMEGPR